MTHIPDWPVLGQAKSSRLAQTLARHAGWTLIDVPADYGLPLAAFMEHRPAALLLAVADRDLVQAAVKMEPSLLASRSDGIIICDEAEPWFPPFMAIGQWRSGTVTWYQPLVPWAAADRTMWLVPPYEHAVATGMPSFRLTPRYLKPEPSPWHDLSDRAGGLKRAATMLRAGDA